MSEARLRCLYAENLQGRRVEVEIESVRTAPRPLFSAAGECAAWDVMFTTRTKAGEQPYIQIPKPGTDGKATIILRQYIMATGTEPCEDHKG